MMVDDPRLINQLNMVARKRFLARGVVAEQELIPRILNYTPHPDYVINP